MQTHPPYCAHLGCVRKTRFCALSCNRGMCDNHQHVYSHPEDAQLTLTICEKCHRNGDIVQAIRKQGYSIYQAHSQLDAAVTFLRGL